MKLLLSPVIGTTLLLALTAQPALAAKKDDKAAASATGAVVPGMGWANIEAIHALSNAYKSAAQQREVTYKPIADQANARAVQLDNQLKAMRDKIEADSKLPKPNEAALNQQVAAFQKLQEAGKQEIQRILLPIRYSEAFVDEQIDAQMEKAVELAMAKRKITFLVRPDAIVFAGEAYNLNQPILDELNVLIPNANLVPPQGWEPRQIREARAQAAAQQGIQPGAAPAAVPAAAPARPAGPQPDGR